jgi:hypothetical protein
MKLRIMGNSLRLRVSRSELHRLVSGNRIGETIRFAPEPEATLTYVLESAAGIPTAIARYSRQRITVVIDQDDLRTWNETTQVGIYASLDIGSGGRLELIVEKDFACLDENDEQNEDAFANPHARCELVK